MRVDIFDMVIKCNATMTMEMYTKLSLYKGYSSLSDGGKKAKEKMS